MDRVAIVISGSNELAVKVCERMRRKLRGTCSEVQIYQLAGKGDFAALSLEGYDGIMLGASIENSAIPPFFEKWVLDRVAQLNAKPLGFFAVAPRHPKMARGDNLVVDRFLAQVGLAPNVVSAFHGPAEVAPAKPLGIFQKQKSATVPSDLSSVDWDAVAQFVDAFELAMASAAQGRVGRASSAEATAVGLPFLPADLQPA